MTKNILTLVSGAALLAGMGAASAGEPVTLTGAQLDGVTAGGPTFFSFEKVVTSINLESVVADVDLDGTILQAAADAEGQIVTDGDYKVETSAIVTQALGELNGGVVQIVTSQSLALIAIEPSPVP